MFSRTARPLLQRKALAAFRQQKRAFSSEADLPAEFPTFLERPDSVKLWAAVGLPAFAAWTSSTIFNTSHDIYYPPEATILEEEYKAGLRDADYRPLGKSLDQY